MRSDGIEVILIWPTIIRSKYENNIDFIEELKKALGQNDINFDSNPEMLVNPDSLAFDTPYHMSLPAVKLNTSKLIYFLKNYIGKNDSDM